LLLIRSLRFACLFATAACATAPPPPPPPSAPPPTAPAGSDKAAGCLACHGAGAPSMTAAPSLVGKPAAVVARQLTAYRRGERVHPLMTAISHQLTDADIAELAAFWAGQPAGAAPRVTDAAVTALWHPQMAFPSDFPAGFTLYQTSNNPDRGAINHMYINAIGLAAARRGQDLPDGSVIIMAVEAPKLGADGKPAVTADGMWTADHLASYSGMEVHAGTGAALPALLRNADWTYNLFNADRTPRTTNQAECLACHRSQAAVDYVFSFQELHDTAAMK
jgi:cytochrome c553